MEPIWRPAAQATAESIRKFSAFSGKRHLFLTGRPGSGKSTLLRALAPDIPRLLSWAEPGKGVWLDAETPIPIGIFDPDRVGAEGKMQPLTDRLNGPGRERLEQLTVCASEWVCIDEIGYLEASAPDYLAGLETLLNRKRVMAAVRKGDAAHLQALLHREDALVIDLDRPVCLPGCVIMASGLGKRFGGNKLLADFDGQPLICRVLDATEGLFYHRVVVTRHAEVAALCRSRGIECVLHDLPDRSDTVRLGLEALDRDCSGCLFCPGDQPLLTGESVGRLLLQAAAQPEAVVSLSCQGVTGAPVWFPRDLFPELWCLPKGKGGRYVAARHPDRALRVEAEGPEELRDIDTPEALAELLSIQRAKR